MDIEIIIIIIQTRNSISHYDYDKLIDHWYKLQ